MFILFTPFYNHYLYRSFTHTLPHTCIIFFFYISITHFPNSLSFFLLFLYLFFFFSSSFLRTYIFFFSFFFKSLLFPSLSFQVYGKKSCIDVYDWTVSQAKSIETCMYSECKQTYVSFPEAFVELIKVTVHYRPTFVMPDTINWQNIIIYFTNQHLRLLRHSRRTSLKKYGS